MRIPQAVMGAWLAGALSMTVAVSGAIAAEGADVDTTAIDVKVERLRPKREKHPTLRFLKANRNFLRARLDLLREEPRDGVAGAEIIDPRFLAYRDLMQAALSSSDSVRVSDEERQRRTLFSTVTELGQLESQLDQLERLLEAQRGRLTALQADFTGHQRTSLVIVAKGYPVGTDLHALTFALEDGGAVTLTLTDAQRVSLREGGVLELFHGLVEPREQVVEVVVAGNAWPTGDRGYVSLSPSRDRLQFLQLDLSALQATTGAPGLRASTWLMDTNLPISDGAGAQP